MSFDDDIDTEDELMLELVEVLERQRAPKKFRIRENHFKKWSDKEFLQRFRLSKFGVRFILGKISQQISHPTNRNNAITPEVMLFVTLRYYSTGSFLQVVGDFVGIDKSTASRIVDKVSREIARLHTIFIKMPAGEEEMALNSAEFYRIARFPKCIGALDCTHVKISSPGGEEPEIYRNRKNFFSMNVQAISDATCKFQNIVCRWTGSSHDSTIFQNSRIKARFQNGEFRGLHLLGDGGYGIKEYLLTPLGNPRTPAEILYNESQIRSRNNPIERTFGIWKRRFPVLAFGIRLKISKVEAIVVATAVLHNIAILLNEDLPLTNEEEENAIANINNIPIDNVGDGRNVGGVSNITRYNLIHDCFTQLG